MGGTVFNVVAERFRRYLLRTSGWLGIPFGGVFGVFASVLLSRPEKNWKLVGWIGLFVGAAYLYALARLAFPRRRSKLLLTPVSVSITKGVHEAFPFKRLALVKIDYRDGEIGKLRLDSSKAWMYVGARLDVPAYFPLEDVLAEIVRYAPDDAAFRITGRDEDLTAAQMREGLGEVLRGRGVE